MTKFKKGSVSYKLDKNLQIEYNFLILTFLFENFKNQTNFIQFFFIIDRKTTLSFFKFGYIILYKVKK